MTIGEMERLTAALSGTVAQVEEQRKRAERAEAKVAILRNYGDALCREAAAVLQFGMGHLADAVVAWRTVRSPEKE